MSVTYLSIYPSTKVTDSWFESCLSNAGLFLPTHYSISVEDVLSASLSDWMINWVALHEDLYILLLLGFFK